MSIIACNRSRAPEVTVRTLLLAAGAAATLAGCATLPASGPTARKVRHDERKDNALGFHIVEIDAASTGRINALVPGPAPFVTDVVGTRIDTLGIGDILDVGIYEVGVSLFNGTGGAGGGAGAASAFDAGARGTVLQSVSVNMDGDITLPYIGRLHVAGKSPSEVERMIEHAMAGLSQRPQAVVSVRTNQFNTIYVSGDIRAPQKLSLGLPREHLLDAIARAGGTVNQPNDMVVRLTRGGVSYERRLSDIATASAENVELLPGDRVELFNRPRTFLVFGSTDKVSQVPFGASRLSLAEALARIGGPSDRSADPAAVYIFRYASATPGAPADQPIIYRLNMMRAQSYFASQEFQMQDKDVIYIASAASNAPAKLAQIFGQLFSPFLAVQAVTR